MKTAAPLQAMQDFVADDLARMDQWILESLVSDVSLIQEVAHYMVEHKGKRLRPSLLILVAKQLGYTGTRHLRFAAVVELLHTATLLHDDVVDHADVRRGRKSANMVWGNEASVLTGDFLHALVFQMLFDLNDSDSMQAVLSAITAMITGEVMQLVHRQDTQVVTQEAQYLQAIDRKTARLFSLTTELGGRVAGADAALVVQLAGYGQHIGLAYQLMDDVLDYTASTQETGKAQGNDFMQGKPTLPFIYALEQADPEECACLLAALQLSQPTTMDFDQVCAVLRRHQAFEYTRRLASVQVGYALEALEPVRSVMDTELLSGFARAIL